MGIIPLCLKQAARLMSRLWILNANQFIEYLISILYPLQGHINSHYIYKMLTFSIHYKITLTLIINSLLYFQFNVPNTTYSIPVSVTYLLHTTVPIPSIAASVCMYLHAAYI